MHGGETGQRSAAEGQAAESEDWTSVWSFDAAAMGDGQRRPLGKKHDKQEKKPLAPEHKLKSTSSDHERILYNEFVIVGVNRM